MGTIESVGVQVLIDSAFEALKEILKPNMSLDDVAENYSPNIDDIIVKYEKEGVKFSAGKFKIACLGKDSFVLSFELYFQDKNKKWSKVAKSSAPMEAKTWLSKEAWLELRNIGEKVFDVEAPEAKQ